jgi:cysteine desulfurase family protein (TIGR01976 family)
VQEIRSRFPGLARTGEDGRPIVFADAPGGSQVPESVIEAMAHYLRTSNTNSHGAFVTSHETDALIEEARRAGADMTGADSDEIVFGPNSTSLLFSLSRAFGRTLKPGDEIVVTRLDHDANVRPWVLAAEDAGATVRWVDVLEDDVTLDLDSLDSALTDRTRLVAFTLASNAVGTIPPAAEIVRRVHAAGALAAVDAVHLAQHRALDVRAIDADVLACSPYKFFGPHLGMLAVRRELLESWTPYKLRPAPDTVPARWETGTQNHEGLAGMVAAVEYLADVGRSAGDVARDSTRRAAVVAAFDAIREHERGLSLRFLDGLGSVPDVRLWGIAAPERVDERTPTFAIRLGDLPPEKVAAEMGSRGIHVWDGHYYAITIMERLGLLETGGAVRVGFCHYHTPEEVDRVVETLAAVR